MVLVSKFQEVTISLETVVSFLFFLLVKSDCSVTKSNRMASDRRKGTRR
jgi:hypothetical protein